MKHIARFLLLGVCIVGGFFPASVWALEHLEGDRAFEHIGNLKERLTAGKYTYEVLSRSHRDTMNGRFSDGVIFSNITDRFYYRTREDGRHVFIVGHPDGRPENPVTAEPHVWNPLANTLNDDHPQPHVFLEDGKELAIIYIGRKTRIKPKINKDGLLEIQLTVRGQRSRPNRKT